MIVLEPHVEPYAKPLPEPNDHNAPFLAGLQQHQFLVPRCQDCGDFHWTPYPACRSCFSDALVWTPVSGDAHLYSYTVVHRGVGPFTADVPYVVAMAELAEHPRPCLVVAELVGTRPEDLRIGLPLQIGFVDLPRMNATVYRWVARG